MDHEHYFIGAEVFIEPGQSAEDTDTWFRRLDEYGMRVTRIRLFESYMRTADGGWDFSLFDRAFRAAEKYNIAVYGNLFPLTDFTDVGGFKFPSDEDNLNGIAEYIRNVVPHFRQFSSLVGWVPINEPGSGLLPDSEFTKLKFTEWKTKVTPSEYTSNGYTTLDFHEQKFLLEYNTWFLEWLVLEIRKYDSRGSIHVNNHALFQHSAEYDFPQWSKFLTSLGGSAHASWHFGYLERSQFAVGLSAKSELIRSGAGTLPWFMTELQGGNNTYSAFHPMCPTSEEITQWLWIVIATGGRGALFWCLNPRASGFEAGEWAMLDYYNEPSDRLLAAAGVMNALDKHAAMFAGAMVAESGIDVVYTRQSLWIEKALQVPGTVYEGRAEGGVMKSALAWFEALGELGVQSGFKEIGEYDFNRESFTGRTIILAHQVSLPSAYWPKLERFVSLGGKLIADGLTAYYDENAHCILGRRFPLARVFGAGIREVKLVGNIFRLPFGETEVAAHLWRGTLAVDTAEVLSCSGDEKYACTHRYGEGQTWWIPSLLGLGGRVTNDYTAVAGLLEDALAGDLRQLPVRFTARQPRLLMKCLKAPGALIAVIVNTCTSPRHAGLCVGEGYVDPEVVFHNGSGSIMGGSIMVDAGETLVVWWKCSEKQTG